MVFYPSLGFGRCALSPIVIWEVCTIPHCDVGRVHYPLWRFWGWIHTVVVHLFCTWAKLQERVHLFISWSPNPCLCLGMYEYLWTTAHDLEWTPRKNLQFCISHIVDIGRYQLLISTFWIFLLERSLRVRPHRVLRGMQCNRPSYLAEDSKHSMNFWYRYTEGRFFNVL